MKQLILRWLGLADHTGRIEDLERHFVTKRNAEGLVVETLADVPLEKRKDREFKMRGMTMQQRRAFLEASDGGRKVV
jgi:hypothetical protein